jgi:hypothetical protein
LTYPSAFTVIWFWPLAPGLAASGHRRIHGPVIGAFTVIWFWPGWCWAINDIPGARRRGRRGLALLAQVLSMLQLVIDFPFCAFPWAFTACHHALKKRACCDDLMGREVVRRAHQKELGPCHHDGRPQFFDAAVGVHGAHGGAANCFAVGGCDRAAVGINGWQVGTHWLLIVLFGWIVPWQLQPTHELSLNHN